MNDDKLDKMLEKLDRIIDLLSREKPSYVPTYPPTYPGPNVLQQPLKCLECGIRLDQVMGYVCNNSQCPTSVRVTSAAYSGQPWQSYNDEDNK